MQRNTILWSPSKDPAFINLTLIYTIILLQRHKTVGRHTLVTVTLDAANISAITP